MTFDVLLIDPPWEYRNKKTGGTMKSGSASQYETMTMQEVADLAPLIKQLSHEGTICFLWVTTPIKYVGEPFLEHWGFKYKTTVYWHKTGRLGMGFWFRGEVEELFLGAGKKAKAFRSSRRNHIDHEVLGHSKKPEVFCELIEEVTPGAKRLELFATREREGWTTIGYEVDGLDIRESLKRLL